jgi:glutathione peroxidase
MTNGRSVAPGRVANAESHKIKTLTFGYGCFIVFPVIFVVLKKMTMFKSIILGTVLLSCAAQSNNNTNMNTTVPTEAPVVAAASIYDFKVPALDGTTIDFAAFKGKKILIVNTASECGYTPQYKDLQELYSKFGGSVVVVGFPANNFGGQEPGANPDIKTFCTKNYGVTFPMAAKVSVKGEDIAPIFKWLTNKSQNGVMDAEIRWNFTKFLVDENGKLIAKFDSKVAPMSEEIISKLK